jgi:signal transduction histidine kinase/HAMP domain-containing protein
LKLSVKYSATILSLIFCIVLAFASVILIQFRSEIARLNSSSAEALRQSVLKGIREKESASVRVLASTLVNPLYQLDMLKIGEIVSAVRRQPDVLYVYVFDKDRRIIIDGTKTLESYGRLLDDSLTTKSMRTAQFATEVMGDAFHVASPVKIQDEIIGGVKIGYSVKRILSDIAKEEEDLTKNYQAVWSQQLITIGLLALAFSIMGLIVAVLVARNWSYPIILLSKLTARVGAGDYDVNIPVERSDEIGGLANSFQQMVSNLKMLRQHELESSENLRLTNAKLTESNGELVKEVAERERAEQEIIRHNHRMQLLHEINSAINATLDRQVLLDTLVQKIGLLLPYSATSVHLLNPASGKLEATAWQCLHHKNEVPTFTAPLSDDVFGRKAPVLVRNFQNDRRIEAPELFLKRGLISYAGIPLITEGEILGVLGFYTKTESVFPDEEVDFLVTLAGEVATALRKSQLYGELKTQAERLEKANAAKDEFLSVMSHELRTPLNVIMGYAQVMSSGYMGDVTPDQEKSLKKLMLHADDLLHMINDILQAGRIQSGLIDVELETLSVNGFLAEMESAYEFRSKQGVALVWQGPSSLLTFDTDRSKLKHIVQNLVNNAVKFTEEGSVTVTVRRINEAVEFKVEDTGIGIPGDSLTTIFEMFRQADSSKTRTYGGTGVGLFIVKKFTEALSGQVYVKSVVGKGTTFTLTFPTTISPDCQEFSILDAISPSAAVDTSPPSSTLAV